MALRCPRGVTLAKNYHSSKETHGEAGGEEDEQSRSSASISSHSTELVPEEDFIYRRRDITPFHPVSTKVYLPGIHSNDFLYSTEPLGNLLERRMQGRSKSESHLFHWR